MDYLRSACFLESHQIDTLLESARSDISSVILMIPYSLAEEFRDAFTEQLAKIGFDEKYNVTPEGKMLEDLIDRFFVP